MKNRIKRIDIEKLLEENKICEDWLRGCQIEFCQGFKKDYCPLVCNYVKEMLKPKDYRMGMK